MRPTSRFAFNSRHKYRTAPPRLTDSGPPPDEGGEPGVLATSVAIDSIAAFDQTNIIVEFGVPVRKADLVAGQRIVVMDGATRLTVQEDGRASDRDGDLRYVSLAVLLPALDAFETRVLDITTETGAPATGATRTVAQLLALDTDAQCTVTADDGTAWVCDFRTAAAGSTTFVRGSAHRRAGFFHDGALRKTFTCLAFQADSGTPHSHMFTEFLATAFSTDNFGTDIRWRFDPVLQNGWMDAALPHDNMIDLDITTGIASPISRVALASRQPAASIVVTAPNFAVVASCTATGPAGTFTVNDQGAIIRDSAGFRAMIVLVNANGSVATLSVDTSPQNDEVTLLNVLSNPNFDTDTAWTKGTGWTIDAANSNKAASDGTQSGDSTLDQANAAIITGATYLCRTVITRSAGTIKHSIGGTLGAARSTTGTFQELVVAGSSGRVGWVADLDFVGTVDTALVCGVFGGATAGSKTITSGNWEIVGFNLPLRGCYWGKEIWHGTRPLYEVRHERDYVFASEMLINHQVPSNYIDNATGRLAGSTSSTGSGTNFLDAQGNYPLRIRSTSGLYMGERFCQSNEPEGHVHPPMQIMGLRKLEGDAGLHIAKSSQRRIYETADLWAQKDGPWLLDDFTGLQVNGGVTGGLIGTATLTIASPCVVTCVAHGLAAGDQVHFPTTGTLPTGVLTSKNYYVLATSLTADTFRFSLSPGGTAVNASGSQSGTHTVTRSRNRACTVENVNDENGWPLSTAQLGILPGVGLHHHESFPFIPYMLTGRLFYLKRLHCDVLLAYLTMLSFNSLGLTRPIWNAPQVRAKTWGDRTLAEAALMTPDAYATDRTATGWAKNDILGWQESSWDQAYATFIDDGSGHSGWSTYTPAKPDFPNDDQPLYHSWGTPSLANHPTLATFHMQYMTAYHVNNQVHLHEMGMLTTNGRKLYRRMIAHYCHFFASPDIVSVDRMVLFGRGNWDFGDQNSSLVAAWNTPGPIDDWDVIALFVDAHGGTDNDLAYTAYAWNGFVAAKSSGLFDDPIVDEALELAVTSMRSKGSDVSGSDPQVLIPLNSDTNPTAVLWWLGVR